MPLFAGKLLLQDEVLDGWLLAERGRCVDWGDGKPPSKPDATGWIVPSPVNAHTHVFDAALRDVADKPRSVPELVGPGGWKQRQLATAKPADLAAGVRRYVDEMAACGVGAFLDFREGGVAGVQALRAIEDLAAERVIFGRPMKNGFDAEEAAALLPVVDGIGLSARRDFAKANDVEVWAEACHKARKPFALHASEAVHEDWEAVLALEPTFIVHGLQATPEEWEEAAQEGIPVVVAPRSNAWFGIRTPLAGMLEAGLTVCVGTDNGMLHDGDLWADLGQLAAWHPKLSVEALLRLVTWNARPLAGLPMALPPKKGKPLDVVVLPERPWGAAGHKPGLVPHQVK